MPIVSMEFDKTQFRQLADTLKDFGDKELRLAVRSAVKKGIEPMVRKVQITTPVGESGQLARSIGVKVKQYPRSGVTVGIVGARKGFKVAAGERGNTRNIDPVNYLHLVALGHKIVTGSGGSVPGNPFLKIALKASARRVVVRYQSELGKRVELATKRAARKIKKSKV